MPQKEKISKLLNALNEGVYEKEEAIKLSLLTSIAGESIFFLGLPGVAKSLIARRLKFAFKDAKSFEYLMNRFSTPDEIFGPISVIELQQDNYKRIVENYLPDAEIAFLDEIWKAGPAIQNVLLTVLNEKVFRNGKEEIKVKLKGLISASNELPADNDGNGDSVDALWDRFLMRLVISGIEDEANFNSMIGDDLNPTIDNVEAGLKITDEEYQEWNKEINTVKIPDEVYRVIDVIRKKIQAYNDTLSEETKELYVSDRRWRKIVRILRTSAFLNDRAEIDLMDCFLIKDCIWNNETEIEKAQEIVVDAIEKYGYSLTIDTATIESEIKHFDKEVKEETTTYKKSATTSLVEYPDNNKIYYKITNPNVSENVLEYIDKKDFAYLSRTDTTIYFHDLKNKKTTERLYVQKGDNDFSVKIDIDSQNPYTTFNLENKASDEKIIKKPNRHTLKGWNDHIGKIETEIERAILIINKHREDKLPHLHTNIFISNSKASIVEHNLHVSIQQLNDLKLETQKIKSFYDGLE